ncbi:site-specific recombinase XerD [Novosphingobium sp. PhB55]|uniref:site-specific integrase n=1 Tax=Novosphingobium sp. PhB55 TaxID=2485106 RepID=UPI001065B0BE|nr:site-specific integrase [Novosphingobium sp. PhB55]TDW65030.1 site-specific recombinase XerD [Novosphingobium sp. PhB55]
MPRVKLDASFCLTARCEPGKKRTDYYDTSITGFTLECRSGGGKSFTLRYSNEYGKQCQRKIGVYGDITYDQARRVAQRWRSEVVLGGDPAAQKAAKKAIPTFAELARQHISHNETYQKTPHNTERIIRCHLVPKWGTMRLDEIKPQAIATWLAEKRKVLAPATVEKIRVTMNRSFELAAEWNMPGASPNPVRSVKRPKFNNKREKFLTTEEAKRLLAACDSSLCKQLGSIVRLLLLTGARKMELLRAKWSDINLERRAWHIPETKTGVPRYVPLSSDAVTVIQGLRRWDKCLWLIPNPETRKPYTDLKRPWDTARDKASLPALRLHDLRHSAASFLVNSGVDLYAVGKILGHADHQSTMRYAHLANDTLMSAVEAGAAKMQLT